MAIETAISLRLQDHSNVAPPRNAPNDVERMNISARQPVGSATNGSVCLAYPAPPQALLVAVEDQRVNLLNVLGIVHCMSDTFGDAGEDRAPEISAAFALLEQEIQRVITGLEEVSLRDAISVR